MKISPKLLDRLRQAVAASDPPTLTVRDIDVYSGASPYSDRPALVCHLEIPSLRRPIGELLQALAEAFPGHFDAAAGAVADGKSEAATLAAVAAALAARLVSARTEIDLGCGAQNSGADRWTCWVEYFPGGSFDRNAALVPFHALAAVLVTIGDAAAPHPVGSGTAAHHLQQLAALLARPLFHQQSLILINAARRRNLPVLNVGGSILAWQFGWGSRSELFFVTASGADGAPGHQCTKNKAITKTIFRELGLPTPDWRILSRPRDAPAAADAVGWPCVVKPLDQAHGVGVTANVRDASQLAAAVSLACAKSPLFMIEAHEPGWDYRLMVVDGRLVAAVRREPPFVTGDGRRSVEQLLAELNERRRGPGRAAGYLSPVETDAELMANLAAQGASLDTVLPEGRQLPLRSIANRSTGGIAVDETDKVHPQVRDLAEMLATSVGLRTAGVDYITTDISRSPAEIGGGFIEVNAMPGITVLMAAGRSEEEIASLLLGDRPGRIPVTLVTGPQPELDRAADAIRGRIAGNKGAAMVDESRAQIGSVGLPVPALNPLSAVNAVLRYRSVESVTIAWSLDRLYKFGLPVDRLQRAVILGPAPEDRWLSLLRRVCSDVVFAPDADSAARDAHPAN